VPPWAPRAVCRIPPTAHALYGEVAVTLRSSLARAGPAGPAGSGLGAVSQRRPVQRPARAAAPGRALPCASCVLAPSRCCSEVRRTRPPGTSKEQGRTARRPGAASPNAALTSCVVPSGRGLPQAVGGKRHGSPRTTGHGRG
jgi:hypothetical protein